MELASRLQNQSTVTDGLARSRIQSHSIRSGVLLQNLGSLLLELGRTIMTIRMGQMPKEAIVNVGPAVFVSCSSPNQIMVQAAIGLAGSGSSHPAHVLMVDLGVAFFLEILIYAYAKALIADFEVFEGIYSQACIEESNLVCLSLGVNVMLKYSYDEAISLLWKNLENAKASLEVLVADLQFLSDQVTIAQRE